MDVRRRQSASPRRPKSASPRRSDLAPPPTRRGPVVTVSSSPGPNAGHIAGGVRERAEVARSKVELFEAIRRDNRLEQLSVRALADEDAVQRRTVRQALENAVPPERKVSVRVAPKLDPAEGLFDAMLASSRTTTAVCPPRCSPSSGGPHRPRRHRRQRLAGLRAALPPGLHRGLLLGQPLPVRRVHQTRRRRLRVGRLQPQQPHPPVDDPQHRADGPDVTGSGGGPARQFQSVQTRHLHRPVHVRIVDGALVQRPPRIPGPALPQPRPAGRCPPGPGPDRDPGTPNTWLARGRPPARPRRPPWPTSRPGVRPGAPAPGAGAGRPARRCAGRAPASVPWRQSPCGVAHLGREASYFMPL